MFRIAFISIIALRVVLCPLFCGSDENASGEELEQSKHCVCSHEVAEPCGCSTPSDESPTPCDSTCLCQFTPELNYRASSDFVLTLEYSLACSGSRLEVFQSGTFQPDVRPHRVDVGSGRAIRLTFESLLL